MVIAPNIESHFVRHAPTSFCVKTHHHKNSYGPSRRTLSGRILTSVNDEIRKIPDFITCIKNFTALVSAARPIEAKIRIFATMCRVFRRRCASQNGLYVRGYVEIKIDHWNAYDIRGASMVVLSSALNFSVINVESFP